MTNKCDFHVSGDIDDTLPIIYGVFQDQGVGTRRFSWIKYSEYIIRTARI